MHIEKESRKRYLKPIFLIPFQTKANSMGTLEDMYAMLHTARFEARSEYSPKFPSSNEKQRSRIQLNVHESLFQINYAQLSLFLDD